MSQKEHAPALSRFYHQTLPDAGELSIAIICARLAHTHGIFCASSLFFPHIV
jgi:hypothetical protein